MKFAKAFFSKTKNARSYLLNIYIEYFNSINKLDELKLTDDTMIIFASDNGGMHWNMSKKEGHKYTPPITSNYPLRGGKCSWFEGGVSIPMTIKWPGKVAPNQRIDTPVHLIDLYPTILSAVQAKPKPEQVLDGLDLSPLFQNGTLPERPLFCHFPRNSTTADKLPGASFIRLGDYKLIRMYGGEENGDISNCCGLNLSI